MECEGFSWFFLFRLYRREVIKGAEQNTVGERVQDWRCVWMNRCSVRLARCVDRQNTLRFRKGSKRKRKREASPCVLSVEWSTTQHHPNVKKVGASITYSRCPCLARLLRHRPPRDKPHAEEAGGLNIASFVYAVRSGTNLNPRTPSDGYVATITPNQDSRHSAIFIKDRSGF
jgi:hypothetical protein